MSNLRMRAIRADVFDAQVAQAQGAETELRHIRAASKAGRDDNRLRYHIRQVRSDLDWTRTAEVRHDLKLQDLHGRGLAIELRKMRLLRRDRRVTCG